jgi:hypothetical protein
MTNILTLLIIVLNLHLYTQVVKITNNGYISNLTQAGTIG